jgi:MoaA/NifB/PqqE/SkfB family radical SAM enzyme
VTTEGPRQLGKRLARSFVGAVSPALLRSIERARLRARLMREPTHGPRRILLEPTTACNHRCLMCIEHSAFVASPAPGVHMPFEQLERLVRDMAGIGVEEVWLAGRGEPLVHPQAREMLEMIGALGMHSSITTNGQRLDDELADWMCGWGMRQLSVSIDSGTPETYARVHRAKADDRARLLALIKRLSQRGEARPKLLVSMVISRPNCGELLRFVEDAIGAGVDAVVVGGMRPVSFDTGELALSDGDWARVRDDLLLAQAMAERAGVELWTDNIRPSRKPQARAPWPYERMACFIGHMFAVIDVHGNVHGCCTCQNRLGSLGANTFPEIWRSHAYRLYRKALRELPAAGVTPPMCDCRYGCGHIPENAALQQELAITFSRRSAASESATRLDLARVLSRALGSMLPSPNTTDEFADLGTADEQARREAARLRALGVMKGTGSLDGRPVFDPTRMVARVELEEILTRTLGLVGVARDRAQAIIAESKAGSAGETEPLTKRDLESWVAGVGDRLNRSAT